MRATYFANPNSIHVRRWLTLLHAAGIEVRGFSAERIEGSVYGTWDELATRGGFFRYAFAGLLARFAVRKDEFVHAHSASGYGLMALLSGRRYAVTIYGSEIYTAGKRGRLYSEVVRRVLRGAERVTCTTPAMQEYVVDVFGLDPARVHMFSMGISSRVFFSSQAGRQEARRTLHLDESALVVTSNRRMRPQYRIDLIVRAFAILHADDARYRLILFEGDSNPAYVAKVCELVEELDLGESVIILRGFQSPDVVRRHLLASDLVVSIPTSDQMSASILEALACGASVLAADLPAYRELFEAGLAYPVRPDSHTNLAASIAAAIPESAGSSEVTSTAAAWLQKFHSDEAVTHNILAFYAECGGEGHKMSNPTPPEL